MSGEVPVPFFRELNSQYAWLPTPRVSLAGKIALDALIHGVASRCVEVRRGASSGVEVRRLGAVDDCKFEIASSKWRKCDGRVA